MNGIRENMFVVVLIGATVVLVGALLPWGFSIDEKIEDEEMAERAALSSQIQNLSRPNFNNQDTIAAAQAGVSDLNSALADVCHENVKWNRRNFEVVSLELPSKAGTCSVLPFPTEVWKRYLLAYPFVAKSHMRLDALLALLKPTTLPTEVEINKEATKWQRRMDRDEQIRRKKLDVAKAVAKKGPRAGDRLGLEDEMGMMMPGVRRGSARTGAGDIRLSNEAIQEAQENLKLRKAQQGWIYATKDSLDIMFPKTFSRDLTPEQVWKTQLSLWVQTDILQAIRQTIVDEMKLQNLMVHERNVIRSPIKRLGRIVVGAQADTVTTAAPMDDMMMDEMLYKGSKKSRKKDTDIVAVKPLTLTRNSDNTLFDVVNYSFTVLMPTRYIPALQANLLKRNYHVILNQQIHKSLEEKTTTTRPGADVADLYYYGTESVRWVTFTGQLLLLTDWVRGKYDYKEKKWFYEPLMPLDVLKTLPKEAWRSVDRERIEDIDRKKRRRPLKLTAPEIKIYKTKAAAVPAKTTTVPNKAKKTTP